MTLHSLGILIWQCASQTFPFEFTDEITEGTDAAAIRKMVTQSAFPWNYSQEDPLLAHVSRLVGSCCAPRPSDRPSAAQVEHSLFEMLSRAYIGVDLEPLVDESAKTRVADLLEQVELDKASQSSEGISTKLADEDVMSLYSLADGGDSLAALYLGNAILSGLATPKGDDNPLVLIAGRDDDKCKDPPDDA